MRKCKGKYYQDGKFVEFEGYFHQWGLNYDEFEGGPGNYSVAIVELENGEIIIPPAENIKFLAVDIQGENLFI